MCLWLITACLGLLPSNPPPPNIIVVQGVPTPILQPTTAATTAVTTASTTATTNATTTSTTTTPRPSTPGNMTSPPPTPTMPSNNTGSPTTNMTTTTTTARPTNATTASTSATTATPTMSTAAPNSSTTGSLPIDPRLGTTPQSSAAMSGPPITGYSAQVPSFDTAVRFPRERRSADSSINGLFKRIRYDINVKKKHNIQKRQSCRCVPSGTCVRTSSGAGMIDVRIVTPGSTECPAGQEYCCGSTTSAIACGTLQAVPSTITIPSSGQASFGEFPWQALVLTKQNDYIAGGVLIDQLNVLTVTHRLTSYIVSGTAPNVKVRLGEWDAAGTYEPIPYQEYTVQKVFSHPSYNPNTLQYDLTVLRLSAAVPFTPANGSTTTINRACLPPTSSSVYNGLRCWVSGWGKDMFGLTGQYQQIIKKVDVPIVAPATCQSQMQAARLGPTFVLDTTSFVCAGGEANKDACTGDGGSGLVCQVNGQWVVVGLVAWGLGCANANVSAAYVNVAGFLPWIQQQIAAA
ncbi:phenoloxidase-activating factor 2 [Battus philenor]|uniref:phenoloxidase-activating factor 2 n=1 Tax=Battus philenor TaxID=42288 RepID=UPI0035CF1C53